MPGAFAHLTLVNLLREPQRLEAFPDFPRDVISWILKHFKYCELGAVSPDYPYLAITDSQSLRWADLMHYIRSGEMIREGIAYLRQMPDGVPKQKATVWLLGYASHVIADVTIHPIIELKVGPYAQNKQQHRICEMHQDSYIFQRLNLGGIGVSEHFESGINTCSATGSRLLDPDISVMWASMLKAVHPQEFMDNPPGIDKWHQAFYLMVNKIGEEGNKLIPLARHVAVNCGLTYPNVDEIDFQYIKNLKTPNANMHYDDIFDNAVKNVANAWVLIAKSVVTNSLDVADKPDYKKVVGNWNLDTGRDQDEKLVFWA